MLSFFKMLRKALAFFTLARPMKQTLLQVMDIIVKSQPMRPTANKISDQSQDLKEMQKWDAFKEQSLYNLFSFIKQTKNLVLFKENKHKFLKDDKVSTTTEFYQFVNRHKLDTSFFNYVEYDQKYNFDARLTELLQSEKNFVQSNNTDWETMLSFFGPPKKIIQTIEKLLDQLDSPKIGSPIITVDSERHKLFIKSNDGPLIACKLLFTETLEESQDPMGVKIYYDGSKTSHIPQISSRFGTCSFNDIYARKITRDEIFLKWIGTRHCCPCGFIMNYREITFKQHILHRCGIFNENVNIALVDNEFIIDDPEMCCYTSGVISQSIAQIMYVLQHLENLIIENPEMLYDARKSLDCDVSKYYLKLRFDIDFTRNDNRIHFNQVSLCLYS
jgi:hypothetical protein